MNKMSNLYRIYPVLWKDASCQQALTVYAIDRPTPLIPTSCSARAREDPAYYWDTPTFQRLLSPPGISQPQQGNAVIWATLPAWLSYIQTLGYTINTDFSRLKPYSDIYITGS